MGPLTGKIHRPGHIISAGLYEPHYPSRFFTEGHRSGMRGSSLRARAKDVRRYSSSAKWPLIAMMVKYHRGISLARWYTKGWPRQPRRYYFVGRLTNDYAGTTFARTKKTLSLNHKKPLPEARTPHIIHGHLDEGFADPFVFRGVFSFLRLPISPRFIKFQRRFLRVYLPSNVPLLPRGEHFRLMNFAGKKTAPRRCTLLYSSFTQKIWHKNYNKTGRQFNDLRCK